MRVSIDDGNGRRPLLNMTTPQIRQAVAIMDCIGRLIPQEGVDYDVDIVFKGANDPSVSMRVLALTDKGVWWRKYVMEMIKEYPPVVGDPPQAIQEGAAGQRPDPERGLGLGQRETPKPELTRGPKKGNE